MDFDFQSVARRDPRLVIPGDPRYKAIDDIRNRPDLGTKLAPKSVTGITPPAYTPQAPKLPEYRDPSTIAEAKPQNPQSKTATDFQDVSQATAGMSPFGLLPVYASAAAAIQMGRDLKRLKRRGVIDPTPQSFRDALQGQRMLAASSRIPGYDSAMDMVTGSNQAALADITRRAQSGSQSLAAATRVNQGLQSRMQDLAMRGAQNQQSQQTRLQTMLGQKAQYEDRGQQNFDRDVAALTGARRQQWFNTATGLAKATTIDPSTLKLLMGGA